MKETVSRIAVETAEDVLRTLPELLTGLDLDTVYVRTLSGESVRLELEEETLTDGSIVYNLLVTPQSV